MCYCCSEEEKGDGNLLPSPFSGGVITKKGIDSLKRRRQQQWQQQLLLSPSFVVVL
jgi:hypothetical protein